MNSSFITNKIYDKENKSESEDACSLHTCHALSSCERTCICHTRC